MTDTDTDTMQTCDCCRREFSELNGRHSGNYCDACNANVVICDDCDDEIMRDAATNVGGRRNTRYVCDSCARSYSECRDCSTFVRDDDARTNDNGESYCESCYRDRYSICEDCGEECMAEQMDEEGRCPDCHVDPHVIDGLRDYSHKPRPKFFSVPGEKTKAFCGIELEMEFFDAANGTDSARIIARNKELYCKADGSLDKGLEMVSHPMTFEYARRFNFESLFEKLKENGAKSWNTDTCGMHVHVSRDAFSALGIFKLQKLIYENPDFSFWISRRPSQSEDVNKGMYYCRVKDFATISNQYAKKAMKKAKDARRYVAVNLENEDTVEIRLFKGTLAIQGFRMNLEFCEALLGFCNSIEVSKCNLNEFQKYLRASKFENAKDHSTNFKGAK